MPLVTLEMDATIVGPTGAWAPEKLEFQAGYNSPQTYLIPAETPVTTTIVSVSWAYVPPREPHLTRLEITKFDDRRLQLVCDSDVDHSFRAKVKIVVELDL